MNILRSCIVILAFALVSMQAQAQPYYDSSGYGPTIVCKSSGYSQNWCAADTRGGVSLVRRISDSACVEGQTWGYDRNGIWVTQGCQAEFAVGRYGSGYGNGVIRCESSGYRQQYCPADTRGGVRLNRQLSDTDCVRGRTWDYDRGGIWVDKGCKAEFIVNSYDNGYNDRARTVRCESTGGRTVRCNVDTRGGVRLTRRLSSSACYQGRSWDYDRGGIWVSNGCRAEFQVGGWGHWRDHDDDRDWNDRR